jgi:ABC-type uncharacterized transport system.
LDKGGRLLLMLEPDPAPSFSDWLDEWGLEAKPGMVVEPANNILGDPAAIFAFGFRFHDITRPFQKAQSEAVLFITARPIKRKTNVPSGVILTELIETSAASWREEKLQGVVRKDPDEESGPFILAAAVEKSVTDKKKMRAVVLADSDFAANQFIRNLLNGASLPIVSTGLPRKMFCLTFHRRMNHRKHFSLAVNKLSSPSFGASSSYRWQS